MPHSETNTWQQGSLSKGCIPSASLLCPPSPYRAVRSSQFFMWCQVSRFAQMVRSLRRLLRVIGICTEIFYSFYLMKNVLNLSGGVQELHECLINPQLLVWGSGEGGGDALLGLTHISHQSSMLCVPRNGSLGPKKGIL